ncbi:hypothetical protein ACQZ5N_23965, partial [Agrobacterium sp. 22-221-1]
EELDHDRRPETYLTGGSILGGNAGSVLSGNQQRTTIKEWLELRHDDIDTKRAAASRAADTVHDIRKRQEATRSSLAAEKSQRSASAVEDARLRIQQAKDRLK